jgi:hypothetical protein
MRIRESRWRRRRRGYHHIITAVGLFGVFLILSGISPGDWAWVFAVLGFVSLILWTRKGLALWNLDRLVFDRKVLAPTTRRRPVGVSPQTDGGGSRGKEFVPVPRSVRNAFGSRSETPPQLAL